MGNNVTLPRGFGVQVIELAVFYPGQERGDLGPCVYQRGTRRMPGIADGDRAVGKLSDLDTAPVGIADRALAPGRGDDLIGLDAVVELHRSPCFLFRGNESPRGRTHGQGVRCLRRAACRAKCKCIWTCKCSWTF